MSKRAAIELTADLALGCFLVLLYVHRAHLAVNTKSRAVVVPDLWLYIPVLLIIAAFTAWWLLGRKKRLTLSKKRAPLR
jgi:hypothetical protein